MTRIDRGATSARRGAPGPACGTGEPAMATVLPRGFPLAAMPLARTSDPAQAERVAAGKVGVEPRRFRLREPGGMDCVFTGTTLGRSRFLGVRLGARLQSRSAALVSIQLLAPARGVFQFADRDGRQREVRAGELLVHSPGERVQVDWPADGIARTVHIDTQDVNARLLALYGLHAPPAPRFARHLCGESRGASLLRVLQHLFVELEDPASGIHGSSGEVWLELLIRSLIDTAPGNLAPLVAATGGQLRSRQLRRCVDYIHAHAQEPIRMQDLVAVSGAALRTLQEGFRRELGLGPSQYVREVKLAQVREALLAADPRATRVADIAADWGFDHGGKFATAYRRRYGELPSETLRR